MWEREGWHNMMYLDRQWACIKPQLKRSGRWSREKATFDSSYVKFMSQLPDWVQRIKYCTILINLTCHTSWAPLCWKSVCVTGHQDCFAKFGLCGLLPHPITCKTSLKLPIWAFLSVEILALSQSQTTCVEVLNWFKHITVTRVCWIDRNGTVIQKLHQITSNLFHKPQIHSWTHWMFCQTYQSKHSPVSDYLQ